MDRSVNTVRKWVRATLYIAPVLTGFFLWNLYHARAYGSYFIHPLVAILLLLAAVSLWLVAFVSRRSMRKNGDW